MTFNLLLLALTAIDVAAVLTARSYVSKKKKWIMWLSLALFACSAVVYVQMLGFAVTAIVNILYVAFSAVFVNLTCYFVFKEKITLTQAVGIVVVLVGVVLLEV